MVPLISRRLEWTRSALLGLGLCLVALACADGPSSPESPEVPPGRWLGARVIDEPLEADPDCHVENGPAPTVGTDDDGTTTVVWHLGCRIHSARDPKGGGFAPAETIVETSGHENPPENPTLGVSAGGDVFVAWNGGGGSVQASRLVGGTWAPPDRIGPALLHDDPSVAVDSAGNGLVVWRSEGILMVRLNPRQGWQPLESLSPAGFRPGAWLERGGEGFVAWVTPDASAVIQSYDVGGGWGATARLLPPAGHGFIGEGRLAFDGRGRAVLLWQTARNGHVSAPLWSMSFDGATWSTRGTVSRPTAAVVGPGADVGMTATGRAVAVWGEHVRVDENKFQNELVSATFDFESGWSVPDRLAVADSMERPHLALNSSGDGMLVYVLADVQDDGLATGFHLLARRCVNGRFRNEEWLRDGARDASVAMDPLGNATVVWWESQDGEIRVLADRFEVGAR